MKLRLRFLDYTSRKEYEKKRISVSQVKKQRNLVQWFSTEFKRKWNTIQAYLLTALHASLCFTGNVYLIEGLWQTLWNDDGWQFLAIRYS